MTAIYEYGNGSVLLLARFCVLYLSVELPIATISSFNRVISIICSSQYQLPSNQQRTIDRSQNERSVGELDGERARGDGR